MASGVNSSPGNLPYPTGEQHGMPLAPPRYEDAVKGEPPQMGWVPPQQHQTRPVHITVQQQPRSTTSVVYVAQNPQPVMVNNAGLIAGTPLISCPNCHKIATTRAVHHPGCQTHMWALLLCLFGCWPCACLPYCTPSCMDSSYYCSNCGSHVATVI